MLVLDSSNCLLFYVVNLPSVLFHTFNINSKQLYFHISKKNSIDMRNKDTISETYYLMYILITLIRRSSIDRHQSAL